MIIKAVSVKIPLIRNELVWFNTTYKGKDNRLKQKKAAVIQDEFAAFFNSLITMNPWFRWTVLFHRRRY